MALITKTHRQCSLFGEQDAEHDVRRARPRKPPRLPPPLPVSPIPEAVPAAPPANANTAPVAPANGNALTAPFKAPPTSPSAPLTTLAEAPALLGVFGVRFLPESAHEVWQGAQEAWTQEAHDLLTIPARELARLAKQAPVGSVIVGQSANGNRIAWTDSPLAWADLRDAGYPVLYGWRNLAAITIAVENDRLHSADLVGITYFRSGKPSSAQIASERARLRATRLKIAKLDSADAMKCPPKAALVSREQALRSLVEIWRKRNPGTLVPVNALDMKGATLVGADLSEANLGEAVFSGAGLIGADLSETILIGADLSEAVLLRADLRLAMLMYADLSKAWLDDANLRGAMLSRADLSEANLIRADLVHANLSGAILTSADLTGADLTSADLSRAGDLTKAQVEAACADPSRSPRLPPGFDDIKLKPCPAQSADSQPPRVVYPL